MKHGKLFFGHPVNRNGISNEDRNGYRNGFKNDNTTFYLMELDTALYYYRSSEY